MAAVVGVLKRQPYPEDMQGEASPELSSRKRLLVADDVAGWGRAFLKGPELQFHQHGSQVI